MTKGAPCVVDQVSSGGHEVKVLAQGYDAPLDKAVTVEARKDAQLEAAIQHLQDLIRKGPVTVPQVPTYPDKTYHPRSSATATRP